MNKKFLGIEFGSTRIKSVLIDSSGNVLASGSFDWENSLVDGYWTYAISDVIKGMQSCYSALNSEYFDKFGEHIKSLDGVGISAMMHGYLAFDGEYNLLTPFRTWRNTNTAVAAKELSASLDFNIPERWSAAHFYQAVIDGESHVQDVAHLHTLASYVHYLLCGNNVIGVGDASGMFPISSGDYDSDKIKKYNALLERHAVKKNMYELLPKVLLAGECAGVLSADGARLLDPSGKLGAGAVMCPPEGDAGTGMTATNSVKVGTGNVSAGTSAFAMIVLDKPLKKVYHEIDMVTTPDGAPVAMVHVNNCTNEINCWAAIFEQVIELAGSSISRGELLQKLFTLSKDSDRDPAFIGYNFLSGEPIAGVQSGAPTVIRTPSGNPSLANFMQMQIYSALSSLRLGMEILQRENVHVSEICGHGGFFKTEFVGQNAMSAAVDAPVTVMKNAGEGGAWGIALLALFAAQKGKATLPEFLQKVFIGAQKTTVTASEAERKKFAAFMQKYKSCLAAERAVSEVL